jgi:hypothetical protein
VEDSFLLVNLYRCALLSQLRTGLYTLVSWNLACKFFHLDISLDVQYTATYCTSKHHQNVILLEFLFMFIVCDG